MLGRLWAAAVVTAGTSASLMSCNLEHNSIALWLSPGSQAWTEKCLFRSNRFGCLWGGEGTSNGTALAPAVAVHPGSATHPAPAPRQRARPRANARGAGRMGSNRGHVLLNLEQNLIHGRLWVSPPCLFCHLAPTSSLVCATCRTCCLPALCRTSRVSAHLRAPANIVPPLATTDHLSLCVSICIDAGVLVCVVCNTQAQGGEMGPQHFRARKNMYVDDRGFSRRD